MIGVAAAVVAAACGDKSTTPPFTNVADTVATITLSPSSPTMTVGGTLNFTALVANANGDQLIGRTIEWSSSRSDIARMNDAGVVVALEAGTTTITASTFADSNASSNERKTGTTLLTVVLPVVANVFMTPPSATVQLGKTVQFSAYATDQNGNVLAGKTILWASSDANTMQVNDSGVVTALRLGTATITAQIDPVLRSAPVVVTSEPEYRAPFT